MIKSKSQQSMKLKVTVYCPKGCNTTQTDVNDPWDECAACGSRMTPDDSFYVNALESIESRKIGEFELKKGKEIQ